MFILFSPKHPEISESYHNKIRELCGSQGSLILFTSVLSGRDLHLALEDGVEGFCVTVARAVKMQIGGEPLPKQNGSAHVPDGSLDARGGFLFSDITKK